MLNKLILITRAFKKNKEIHVVAQNFAYLSLLQIASFVFPLLTIPYLARTLGAVGLGKIAFATAIMTWVQTFVDWGFNFSATREIAKNRDNMEVVSQIFSTTLWCKIFLMFVSFFVILLLIFFVPPFKDNALIIILTFLMIPGHILFPDWFFQAIEKMKYISILNLLTKFIFTVLVFVFVKDEKDYIIQPLLVSLGFLISAIFSCYYIFFKWKVQLFSPSWQSMYISLRDSKDLFLNLLMPNLYNSFSVVLLGLWSTPYFNGIYDAGKKVTTILIQLFQIISRACFPFLARNISKHHYYAYTVLITSLIVVGIIQLFAPFIVEFLFGKDFKDSILILRLTSIALFFIMLSNIYGTNFMVLLKKDKLLRNITTISSFAGFLLAFPLVHFFKATGASLTYMISSIILGSTIAYYGIKYKKEHGFNNY